MRPGKNMLRPRRMRTKNLKLKRMARPRRRCSGWRDTCGPCGGPNFTRFMDSGATSGCDPRCLSSQRAKQHGSLEMPSNRQNTFQQWRRLVNTELTKANNACESRTKKTIIQTGQRHQTSTLQSGAQNAFPRGPDPTVQHAIDIPHPDASRRNAPPSLPYPNSPPTAKQDVFAQSLASTRPLIPPITNPSTSPSGTHRCGHTTWFHSFDLWRV